MVVQTPSPLPPGKPFSLAGRRLLTSTLDINDNSNVCSLVFTFVAHGVAVKLVDLRSRKRVGKCKQFGPGAGSVTASRSVATALRE